MKRKQKPSPLGKGNQRVAREIPPYWAIIVQLYELKQAIKSNKSAISQGAGLSPKFLKRRTTCAVTAKPAGGSSSGVRCQHSWKHAPKQIGKKVLF